MENSEQTEDAYFMKDAKKSTNICRGSDAIFANSDALGIQGTKNVHNSSIIQMNCNTVMCSFLLNESSFVYYSGYCNHLIN